MKAPRARMDGTQIPTKIPFVLSLKKKRLTERRNEAKAATRISVRARASLVF